MRSLLLLIILTGSVALTAQTAQTAPTNLPKDPEGMLRAVSASYGLRSANSKPWHMRISYQLYDESEKPSEAGALEYWSGSSNRNRETFTRGSITASRWHTPEGKSLWVANSQLTFAERGLLDQFLSPIPSPDVVNDKNTRFEKETVTFGKAETHCAMLVPKGLRQDDAPLNPGMFPTYCFDPELPILVARLAWGAPTIAYGSYVHFGGYYLSGSVVEYEQGRKILSAKLDSVDGLAADSPALVPPPEATDQPWLHLVSVASGVIAGSRISGEQPAYPAEARAHHQSGTVVLQALIGIDGRIHDLSVVSAPWLSLTGAALRAVETWRYRPYLLNGQPVEVETQINVVFALG